MENMVTGASVSHVIIFSETSFLVIDIPKDCC